MTPITTPVARSGNNRAQRIVLNSKQPKNSRLRVLTYAGAAGLLLASLTLEACNKGGGGEGAPQAGATKKGKKGKGGAELGPVPVVVAKAVVKNMPIELTSVGNVEAYSIVSVRPQVNGQLQEVFVQDGQDIRKGQKLFQIDPRPFEAQVAQMQATLSRDRAQLSQANANLARDSANERYAREQAQRYATLFKEGVVSRDDQDRFASNADALTQLMLADKAAIESAQAQIQADMASLDNLKLQLSFTTLYSSLDGRAGNVTVKAGNIVTANTTELMSIAQVAPIYVTFSVPESRLAEVQRYMTGGRLAVLATSQDNSTKPEEGTLTFIDNNVDTTTGTIKLKGTFANPQHALWPGEYVDVTVKLSTMSNAVVVPNSAMQTGQDGTYVYVINGQRAAEVRPIVAGMRRDQDLVITRGLEAGETVVTEGQLRLAPGASVILPAGADEAGGSKGGKKKQT